MAQQEPVSWGAWIGGGIVGFVLGYLGHIATGYIDVFLKPVMPEFESPLAPESAIKFEADITITRCASGNIRVSLETVKEKAKYSIPNNAMNVRICDDVALDSVSPDDFPAVLMARYPGCFHVERYSVVNSEVRPTFQVITRSDAICSVPFVEGRKPGEPQTSQFNPLLCIGEKASRPKTLVLSKEDFTANPRPCTDAELTRFGWAQHN
jgi:hypothetical protein